MTDTHTEIAFLPLGGTGEIGMNLNLYRSRSPAGEHWLAIDCGIGFGGTELPEVDVMMADPSFIAERRDRLTGLVITHAHEDHIGAVAWLWPQLRCPVYASPFAAMVLRRKLSEAQLQNEVRILPLPLGGALSIGPFSLRTFRMAHSTPESLAIAIDTPHGAILHTGDWKLDPDPLVGPPTDEEGLRALGDEGVLAIVCDSTNAMVEGHSGSESDVRRGLRDAIAGLSGRVAVTCFASNVARVESIAMAAEEAGRSVALVGRSLRNLNTAARDCGYLRDVQQFLSEDDALSVPDDNLLMIVTGSQGEPRSALARIAADTHPNIALGEGDTVVFSSRVIPGNERAVNTVQDNLVRRGVHLITDSEATVHVSGHPAREELRRLYQLVRPRYSVPVHGEWRHLAAQADLAAEMQAEPVMLEDGDILSFGSGRPEIVDSAPVGRLVLDGGRLLPLNGGVLSARRRMLYNGVVLASIAVDEDGHLMGRPKLSAPGLFDSQEAEAARVINEFAASMDSLPASLRHDDALLTEAARSALRRALGRKLQKRPLVDVHLLRI
ncbi:ribonuclease J [Granulibacter bethesdensis]|uniref:Metal-dependent hydrolase n=1 Tax=Granulibacter bethesdensis (strain ATCC BAA-1260 / CGDNIH1) TaxID=391165 RepID=Q0BSL8_GRABC|nr:ribonuclease J [Granulibacter bethesdensis]ABI62184.1 Metal-dependent hydrolase [Granulibacter bethesdensis CGDNIH1]APH52010.1 Metal-dependent hydrolase [Granulibacter bethesdensis]APH64700.1 Metal-dependent hydrolase [Granulibacter bethesdensis]